MKQRAKYEVCTYGNEYYAGYRSASTYKEALLKYNEEVEMAKQLTTIPEADLQQVYIKIRDLKTHKYIKNICVRKGREYDRNTVNPKHY